MPYSREHLSQMTEFDLVVARERHIRGFTRSRTLDGKIGHLINGLVIRNKLKDRRDAVVIGRIFSEVREEIDQYWADKEK